jgi:hypothetical protein
MFTCKESDFFSIFDVLIAVTMKIEILSDALCYRYAPGSSVSIVTGYGLDGPGIESRCGRDFPRLSRLALGPTQPPVQWVLDLSRK